MQLPEQLGRAELNTMDSNVDIASGHSPSRDQCATVGVGCSLREHLAIFDPSNMGQSFTLIDILSLSSSTHLLS